MSASGQGFPSGQVLTLGNGQTVRVGELIGKGGNAYVYRVSGADLAVKLFRSASADIEAKLRAMIAKPPLGVREKSGHVVLAWPQDIVWHGSECAGFVMPLIDTATAVQLHIVANPSDRHDERTPSWVRGFTWLYHLRTAENLAVAVDALHQQGYVIGDFNESNVLVTSQARVSLPDCDSMQVPKGTGEAFLCEAGVPDLGLVAPELLAKSTWGKVREPSSDLYPLAVHTFQLLMDNQFPFDGKWRGSGEMPSRSARAARGMYVFGPNSPLGPPDNALSASFLPDDLRSMFERAFVRGANDPRQRPTATDWRIALAAAGRDLETCQRNPGHVYPGFHKACPWCERDQSRGKPAAAVEQKPLAAARETHKAATARWQPRRAPKTSPPTLKQPIGQRPPAAAPPKPTARVTAAEATSAKARPRNIRWTLCLFLVLAVAIWQGVAALQRHEHVVAAEHAAGRRALAAKQAAERAAAAAERAAAAAEQRAAAKVSMAKTLNSEVKAAIPPPRWGTHCAQTTSVLWTCGVKQDPGMYHFTVNPADTKVLRTVGPLGQFVVFEGPYSRSHGQYYWGVAPGKDELYWFDGPSACASTAQLEYQALQDVNGYYYYLYHKTNGFFSTGTQGAVLSVDHICLYLQTGQTSTTHGFQEPVGTLLGRATDTRITP